MQNLCDAAEGHENCHHTVKNTRKMVNVQIVFGNYLLINYFNQSINFNKNVNYIRLSISLQIRLSPSMTHYIIKKL